MRRKATIVLAVLGVFCASVWLAGCNGMPLLDPSGPIGLSERFVILVSFGLMLIVVIPVAVMNILFPWLYRAGNRKATYLPNWSRSGKIELFIWLVPAVIVAVLGVLVWKTTHRLDPYKPIDTGVRPVAVEVVSLDWKWLFIYPELHVATVNELVFPVDVPLSLRLTSASVMTSFFIPQLGSQIYAMGGMQTRLHLLADRPGSYTGQNQQFSGSGFADMNFRATAASREAFEAWVRKVARSGNTLDLAGYEDLEKPGTNSSVIYFSSVKKGLFDYILRKYGGGMYMRSGAGPEKSAAVRGNGAGSGGD